MVPRSSYLVGWTEARVAVAALLGCMMALFVASPAWAGTVSVTGSGSDKTVVFDAAPGEANSLDVGGSSPVVGIGEMYGGTVTAGAGCVQNGTADVECPTDGVTKLVLNLGDGSDFVDARSGTLPIVANGGAGNDWFDDGSEPDQFNGGDGNDHFVADFWPNLGAPDTFSGGPGEDEAYYAQRSAPLTISLDGVANDGETGENDNIEADVEDVTGGYGNDTITGSDAANHLDGWEGSDRIDGGGGDDVVVDRGCDSDTILGGDGNDDLDGSGGGDTVDGGPGDDTIHDLHNCTRPGDTLSGGAGTDLLVYGGAVDPLNITLDGVADDGVPGENDNVEPDIENVDGGSTPDYIQGDSADNVLNGEGGDDVIVGGGGNDTLQGSIGDDVLDGGPGADTLEGDAGEDVADYSARTQPVTVDLDGQPGDDGEAGEGDTVGSDVEDIWGGSGSDVLTGNEADNAFDGGAGADEFHGLGGEDLVDYSTRTQPVNASIDGVANDGEAGEGDNIGTDIEDLRGGSGNDTLTGNGADNVLDGGPGADAMFGGGGLDTVDYSLRTDPVRVDLDGSPGNDGETGEGDTVGADVEAVIGGAGDDTLIGNASDGALVGGDGNDLLIDPGGSDLVDGGDGDDDLRTRDGAPDEDVCGFGEDTVTGDPLDTVTDDCESVDGPPQPPSSGEGTGSGGGGTTTGPYPRPPRPITHPPVNVLDTIAPQGSVNVPTHHRLASLRKHGLSVTVACTETCSVSVALIATHIDRRHARVSGKTVARMTLPLANSGPRRVVLRLTGAGKRLLRQARYATLRLDIVLTDPLGNHGTLRRTLRFR